MNRKIKTLLLEHDKNDIELIVRELGKNQFDHILEVVETREEFENALKNFSPDLILSDFSLLSFDALSAFTIKQELAPEVPFIVVSGTVGEETAVELIKTGVTDYVLKDKLFTLNGKINRAMKDDAERRIRIRAEKNLAESEKRLEDAQAIAHIGNWEVDLATSTEFWSKEVYNILGIQPTDLAPSLENFLSFIHPENAGNVEKDIRTAKKTFESFSYSTRIIRKDGIIRYINSNGQFVFNEKGEPTRQIGILQDITETKKLEAELIASNKELETFIYRASHDLRGPLSSIIGLTTITKNEITDEKSLKYFGMVEDSAKKLDATLIALVQSMTMRDMSVITEPVDLSELVRDVLTQLKFHDGYSKINFKVDNAIPGKVMSSKLVLKSVFQNLIQNAIKYQNNNCGPSFLNIKISSKSNWIDLVFEDNGIGIDASHQDKIFNMYFRGTSEVSGSGLGLYIVKIGIEKLNGTIRLKSEKGKGATFVIHLPHVKAL